jgi:hypothetical protein
VADPVETLASLRGMPPIGSWVPIHPDGCWPGAEGFITREDASAEARRRGWDLIGRVVKCLNGWTTDGHEELTEERQV